LVLNKRSDFFKFKEKINEYTKSYILIYFITKSYEKVVPPTLRNLLRISFRKVSRRKKFKNYFEKRRWFLRRKISFKIKLQKQRQALKDKRNKKYNPRRWLSFNIFKNTSKRVCLIV
jgi:hypothetical protein